MLSRLYKLIQLELLVGYMCCTCFQDVRRAGEAERSFEEAKDRLRSKVKGKRRRKAAAKRGRGTTTEEGSPSTKRLREEEEEEEEANASHNEEEGETSIYEEEGATDTAYEKENEVTVKEEESAEEGLFIRVDASDIGDVDEEGDEDLWDESAREEEDALALALEEEVEEAVDEDPSCTSEEAVAESGQDLSGVPPERLIYIGKRFRDFAAFEEALQKYCEATYTNLSKVSMFPGLGSTRSRRACYHTWADV